jgi:hypothetical protein
VRAGFTLLAGDVAGRAAARFAQGVGGCFKVRLNRYFGTIFSPVPDVAGGRTAIFGSTSGGLTVASAVASGAGRTTPSCGMDGDGRAGATEVPSPLAGGTPAFGPDGAGPGDGWPLAEAANNRQIAQINADRIAKIL